MGGRVGVGGTYHFSHFHISTRLCISEVLSTQKGTRRQTVTCRGTDHLVLSLFLQQYDGTKSGSVCSQCAPGGMTRNCNQFGTGFKTSEVRMEKLRVKLAWIMSYQSSLQGSNGWSMRSGLSKMSAICSGAFQNWAPRRKSVFTSRLGGSTARFSCELSDAAVKA